MAEIKDSGSRREFGTGAHRDSNDDKGRMDLVPLSIAARMVETDEAPDMVMQLIEDFKNDNDTKKLIQALRESIKYISDFDSIETIILDVSHHYKAGALKYGENNWKLGMGVNNYIDSGLRHYIKARRGDTDEPHHSAFAWNLMCAIWTVENIPGSKYKEVIELEPGITYNKEEQ